MSMPGYREQYPEENGRGRDDWIDGYLAAEHERHLYEQEQAEAEADFWWYLGLDLICMDDDWY